MAIGTRWLIAVLSLVMLVDPKLAPLPSRQRPGYRVDPMRRHLPDRGRTSTLAPDYDGQTYSVTLGYDPAGRVREVFIQGAKVGSGIEGLLDDAPIVLSLALQDGADPATLPRSMGQLGHNGERASVIGAVADLIACNAAIEADPS